MSFTYLIDRLQRVCEFQKELRNENFKYWTYYVDVMALHPEHPGFIRFVNWLTGHVIDSEGCTTVPVLCM